MAVPGAAILVVRVLTLLAAIAHRLAGRETGAGLLDRHRRRAIEPAEGMKRSRFEDLLEDAEGKSAAVAAREAVIGAY